MLDLIQNSVSVARKPHGSPVHCFEPLQPSACPSAARRIAARLILANRTWQSEAGLRTRTCMADMRSALEYSKIVNAARSPQDPGGRWGGWLVDGGARYYMSFCKYLAHRIFPKTCPRHRKTGTIYGSYYDKKIQKVGCSKTGQVKPEPNLSQEMLALTEQQRAFVLEFVNRTDNNRSAAARVARTVRPSVTGSSGAPTRGIWIMWSSSTENQTKPWLSAHCAFAFTTSNASAGSGVSSQDEL